MAKVQIVTLSPKEWQSFKQIRLESLQMEPQAFGSAYANDLQRPDSYWQKCLKDLQAGEKSWLLFGKENERIIGMVGAYCPGKNGVVEIIAVYVTKEKRGNGVASILMTAILESVGKGNAIQKAVLSVNQDQTAAVVLYKNFGFHIVGEKSGVTGDSNLHSGYLMEKEIRI